MKERIGILSVFAGFFVAFIAVVSFSYYVGQEEANISFGKGEPGSHIRSEAGVFQRSDHALDYANMPIDEDHQRSMDTYYDNRAFVGAPPNIPHPVSNERSMGANTCLKCHENGGYVEKFEAYAPVTPHPDYLNCRQCHVAKNTDGLFVESNFEKGAKPAIGTNNALPGSPPAIPHRLQLRENCLACHAGPAAPKEIRVTHPERVNCRQCHAAQNQLPEDFGTFTRKVTTDE